MAATSPCDQSRTPLVSVVVPAFNAEATLGETLESVAAQTYRHLEIVIVDDGSTDRTAEIATAFCATQGGRAQLVRKANGGVASARNCGLRLAKGAWVAPVDADDLWHPTNVAKQVDAALTQPELPGFVYCSFHSVDAEGAVFASPRLPVPSGKIFHQLAFENFVGNGSAMMLRRDVALAVGGYDEDVPPGCADLLLQLKIARDWPVTAVDEHLVGYRVLPQAMSRDIETMSRSWAAVFSWLERSVPPLPREVVRWARALRYFEESEAYALSGRRGRAAQRLAIAVRLDPARCSLLAMNRALRLATRPFRRSAAARSRPRFGELDPRQPLSPNPADAGLLTPLLDRIVRRRLEKLAERDRQMLLRGADGPSEVRRVSPPPS